MVDHTLGPMRYAWGCWKGNGASLFGHQAVRIRVPGTRRGPSPFVRPLIAEIAAAYPQIKKDLLAELYEEFDGARDGIDEDVPGDLRSITDAAALWPHVTLVHVWVGAYGGLSRSLLKIEM